MGFPSAYEKFRSAMIAYEENLRAIGRSETTIKNEEFVFKLFSDFMRHLRRDFSDVEGLNQVSGNHLRHLHPLLGGEVSRPLKFLCRRVAGSASERGNIELIVSLFRVEDVGKRLVYSSSDWLDFSNCHISFCLSFSSVTSSS